MRSHFRYPLLAFVLALAVATMPRPAAPESESEEREGKFDQPDEAMRWIQLAQRDEFGRIDPNGLLRAKSQMDAMRARQARAFAALGKDAAIPSIAGINTNSWTWIGPGNIGGRTRAIAINPSDANNIFIGSVGGGMWRTFNAGASWEVVDDFMANLSIATIQYRPGDPNQMLAGTGEGFFNSDMIRGLGVFRSTDGGSNWSQLPSTNNSDFYYVNRLAYSADGNTVLAATRAGIFRSIDNGDSWNRQLIAPAQGITDVKFIPGSNTSAVAAGFSKNAYSSNDGGVGWTLNVTGLNGNGAASFGRVELGVSASSPNVVYASYAAGGSSSAPPAEMWKSVDFGVSYTLLTTPGQLGAQGWYDNVVWVDPTNVNKVVAAGVSRFRSTDGTNFSSMSGSIHSDHHAIVSHPNFNGTSNRQVYFGNDGGIYRLEDSDGVSFTRLNNNYGVTQFYGGAGHAGSGKIFGGTQDNGTLVYTPAGGPQAWVSTFGADGGFVTADQTDSNYLYGEMQWLGVHRSTNGGSLNSSALITGCGKAAPYILQDSCDQTTNFISPILLDPNEPNRFLAGGRSLWRTDDVRTANTGSTGPSWAVIKAPNGANSSISAIAVPSGNSDLIWIGHNNGDLFLTTSGTSPTPIWNQMDNGSVPNRVATSIAITPSNNNIVYVAFGGFSSGNLWKTIDGGVSWSNASLGFDPLPSVPIRSVVVHPNNPDWIYVGTDVGVFASEDAGANWHVPHDGPANVAVFNLFWMNTTLVAVTHGRGMFTAAVVSTQPPVITLHPVPKKIVAGSSTTFTAAATGAPPITWSWQVWNNSAWATVVDGAPYSGATSPTLTITNAPAGINTFQYRAFATNPGGSTPTVAAMLNVYAAGTNLLTNGDFAGGVAGWLVFEVPDVVWNIVGGVMQFFRASPTTTPSGQAVVYQHSGVSLGAGTPLAASFDLGNSSTVRKRLTVVMLDSNFSDLHVCTFYLAAGAPMRTYQMKTHSNNAWANAAIYFYTASAGSNGGNYLLDNVSLRYEPAVSTARTDCVDPTAPVPPGGAAGPNLLTNGDFTTGLSPWGTFGAITWQITAGVFEFYKPASPPGTPAGVVLQGTGQAMPVNQILTATFQLGNSSAQRRRVTVLVHDGDFSDLVACTFWLTPSQPLGTYSIRMFTTKAWGNATLSVYSATTGAFQWILVDNAVLQTTPAATALGTECFEPPPGPAPEEVTLIRGRTLLTQERGTTPQSFRATTLQKSARYRLSKPARVAGSVSSRR